MQDLDSNLRLKTSAIDRAYRIYLFMHSAEFRFKSQLAFEALSIIIQAIVAVASLFASMVISGNSIDPQ